VCWVVKKVYDGIKNSERLFMYSLCSVGRSICSFVVCYATFLLLGRNLNWGGMNSK